MVSSVTSPAVPQVPVSAWRGNVPPASAAKRPATAGSPPTESTPLIPPGSTRGSSHYLTAASGASDGLDQIASALVQAGMSGGAVGAPAVGAAVDPVITGRSLGRLKLGSVGIERRLRVLSAWTNPPASMPTYTGAIQKVNGQLTSSSQLFQAVLAFVRSRQSVESGINLDDLDIPAQFELTISMDEESARTNYQKLAELGSIDTVRLAKKNGFLERIRTGMQRPPLLSDDAIHRIREHCEITDDDAERFSDSHSITADSIATIKRKAQSQVQVTHKCTDALITTFQADPEAGERLLRRSHFQEEHRNAIRTALTMTDTDVIRKIATDNIKSEYGLTDEDFDAIRNNRSMSDDEIRTLTATTQEDIGTSILPTLLTQLQENGRAGLGQNEQIDAIYESLRNGKVNVSAKFSTQNIEEAAAAETLASAVQSAIDADPDLKMLLSTATAQKIYKQREISPVGLGGSLAVSFGLGTLWETKVTPKALEAIGIVDQTHEALQQLSLGMKLKVIGVNSAVNGLIEPIDSVFGLISLGGSSGEEFDLSETIQTSAVAGLISAAGAAISNGMDYVPEQKSIANVALKLAGWGSELTQLITAISAYPLELRNERSAQLATLVEAQRKSILPPESKPQIENWVRDTVINSPKMETGNAVVCSALIVATGVYLLSLCKQVMTPEQHREVKDGLYNPFESVGVFIANLALMHGLGIMNMVFSQMNKKFNTSLHVADETENRFALAFSARTEDTYLPSKENRQCSMNHLAQGGDKIVAFLAVLANAFGKPAQKLGLVGEGTKDRVVYFNEDEALAPNAAARIEELPDEPAGG